MSDPKFQAATPAGSSSRGISYFVDAVASFNLILMGTSFTAWFGGAGNRAGIADELFGKLRFGRFRADFVWLVTSTAALFLAMLVFGVQARRSRPARVSALLCAAEVSIFVLYVIHAVTSGVLDFG